MPKRIVPKKYLLTQTKRDEIAIYLEGKQGTRLTSKHMKVSEQVLRCIVVAILRHAVMKGHIDIRTILKNY